ncbi:unnamed protein product [Moneuplotes crassus]|uniref:Uncharacterized protein n=1 Tax=Euplotes crassus TaxID=5936 RepID=A0AAD1XII8_EUPCR|nr:unnamed protein product [Moneuplotes crassus]
MKIKRIQTIRNPEILRESLHKIKVHMAKNDVMSKSILPESPQRTSFLPDTIYSSFQNTHNSKDIIKNSKRCVTQSSSKRPKRKLKSNQKSENRIQTATWDDRDKIISTFKPINVTCKMTNISRRKIANYSKSSKQDNLRKIRQKNQSFMVVDKHIKAMVQQQQNSCKRQEKNQERLLDHRYKLTCDEINYRIDATMLNLQKYSDDILLESTQEAQDVMAESLKELLQACKGNKDVYDTIRNISKSQTEIYNTTKSLHLRYKVVFDDFMKQKELQMKEIMHSRDSHKPSQRDPKISTFEAISQIDDSIKELLKDQIERRRELFMTKKFSGVDDILSEVYRYLELIGNSRVEAGTLLSRGNAFDDVQGFVKNQAKALQITSSRFLAERLITEKPRMVSKGTQDNYGVSFLTEVDRLKIHIHELEKIIEMKESQIQEIRQKYSTLYKETESMKIKMNDVLQKCESYEKLAEEFKRKLALKERIINSYEDQIFEITKKHHREIIKLKTDLITLEKKMKSKEEALAKLKLAKFSKISGKIREEQVVRMLTDESEKPHSSNLEAEEAQLTVDEAQMAESRRNKYKTLASNQRNRCVSVSFGDMKTVNHHKMTQTSGSNLEPQVIIKEVECPNCDGYSRSPDCKPDSFNNRKLSAKNSANMNSSEEDSVIDLKHTPGSTGGINSEERKSSFKQGRKTKSPLRRGLTRGLNSKASLLDQISEEDEEEALKKARPSPQDKKLLDKYESRFGGSQGDVMSGGGTFTPKMSFKKEFSPPKVAQEKRGFETFYFKNDKKSTMSKDLKLRSFGPVKKHSSLKKVTSMESARMMGFQRGGTLNPMSDIFLPQPKKRKESSKKTGFSGYVGFAGNDLDFS